MEEVLNTIYGYLATYGLRVVAALAILIIGRWVAKLISKLIGKGMTKAKVDETLANFAENLGYIAMLVFVVIAALGKLGVETTSFAVVVGAAGLAIGFVLQSSLGNFAAGVMLIIFKPFKVDDLKKARKVIEGVACTHLHRYERMGFRGGATC